MNADPPPQRRPPAHDEQQQQQQQQQRLRPHPNHPAGGPPTPRQWLKFLLVILSGFLLGVVLGMLSTSLVFYFVPAPWLEHALKYRRERVQEHLALRSLCKGAGGAAGQAGGRSPGGVVGGDDVGAFVERYDALENVVQICTCWPKGLSEVGGWVVSCTKVQLMGYGEVGSWG